MSTAFSWPSLFFIAIYLAYLLDKTSSYHHCSNSLQSIKCHLNHHHRHRFIHNVLLHHTTTKIFKPSTSLYSEAVSTNEKIEPAFFDEDLYAVLKTSQNATKSELRDAYYSIAFLNHPDKNNSIEALAIFRNASRAYQILGRDEKTRLEYDSKYNTRLYLANIGVVLEEVGTEVIKPLAMDVAVPLINMTMQSIGSFAFPFFKDAFEQSSAVFQAAFGSSDDSNNVGISSLDSLSTLNKASLALEKKTYEQKIRQLTEKLSKTNDILASTYDQVANAIAIETKLEDEIKIVETNNSVDKLLLQQCEVDAVVLNSDYTQSIKLEGVCEFDYNRGVQTIISMKNDASVVASSIESTINEISSLENALAAAKAKLISLNSQDQTLKQSLATTSSITESLKMEYELSKANRVDREDAMITADKLLKSTQARVANSESENRRLTDSYNRNIEYKNILLRKESQLELKKNTLTTLLMETVNAKTAFEVKLAEEINKEIERKRNAEMALIKENQQRKLDDARLRLELQSKELKRIEDEKMRIINSLNDEIAQLNKDMNDTM